MRKSKSYVRDTSHFLQRIGNLGEIPESAILVTMDVEALYPSIPHDAGLQALAEKLEEREAKTVPTEDLVEMADFVLKNNFFEFNGEIKQQISGTAMGTKFAPTYACIFMDKVETDFLASEETQPWVWLRYIDDIFFVWTEGEEELKGFIERINSFHPNLKYTDKISRDEVEFLDVTVRLESGSFSTELYCKPTDKHQYLDYSSSHPSHIKKSVVYSQGLRIKRLCSTNVSCKKHLSSCFNWLVKRGYPEKLVKEQFKKVNDVSREDILNTKKEVKPRGIPLIVTYHPNLSNFGSVMRKHAHLLQQTAEMKCLFKLAPFVSFRTGYSLRNHLVRAKVPPLNREVGSAKCGRKRCMVCKNVTETKTFKSNVTKKRYKINFRLNCDDKRLIYLFNCNVCNLQYVGQTTDKFRFRWNNYKACNKKASKGELCPQMDFHRHFLGNNHNGLISDCSITFIDKTDPKNPCERENFWIQTLKTLKPLGLNTVENTRL